MRVVKYQRAQLLYFSQSLKCPIVRFFHGRGLEKRETFRICLSCERDYLNESVERTISPLILRVKSFVSNSRQAPRLETPSWLIHKKAHIFFQEFGMIVCCFLLLTIREIWYFTFFITNNCLDIEQHSKIGVPL